MFCIQRCNSSREQIAIINGCRKLGIGYITDNHCPANAIPIGDVRFCEEVFGDQPDIKDFFPYFIRETGYVSRDIGLFGNPAFRDEPRFFKDATQWKADLPSGVYQKGCGPNGFAGLYHVSDVVEFTQEWRYYVAGGELVTTGWYQGNDEDEPAPQLSIKWPVEFSGAVDFGRLSNGTIELVEAHAPFACGWYGDNHEDYTIWQYMAWHARSWWLD